MKKSNTRRKELIEYVGNEEIYGHLVDEMVFLEEQLRELRKLPMINVKKKVRTIVNEEGKEEKETVVLQKSTPAQKQYKEFLQQYTNIIKTLSKVGDSDSEEESPLRKYMRELEVR